MSSCLSDHDLALLKDPALDEDTAARMLEHLDSCSSCAQRGSAAPSPHAVLMDQLRGIRKLLDTPRDVRGSDARLVGLGPKEGDRVGPYILTRLLGEGGFGMVFLAQQEAPIRRTVALKLLKPGLDTRQIVSRFEAERQALALMDHPHVARVFDAGATELGRPYFVMEYADGQPITSFCDAKSMPIPARLELFIRVCEAVQHAHQKGIIHRDLKPTNILVTDVDGKPGPKVIDFGIAKALFGQLSNATINTEQGSFVGTPEYMSPEQVSAGDTAVDTRSDIYSLGVILYELLTGALPFDSRMLRSVGYVEMQRIIREDDPRRPSHHILAHPNPQKPMQRGVESTEALAIALANDLDWIVIKALEKQPERRYQSASEFAADIGRHLRNEIVLACPPSRTYRMRRFVRRHRVSVIAAGAVAAALVLGLIGVGGMALVASRQREAAEQARDEAESARLVEAAQRKRAEENAVVAKKEADRANAIREFLEDDLLSSVAPSSGRGAKVRVSEVLEQGLKHADRRFPNDAELRLSIKKIIGAMYVMLGLWYEADQVLDNVIAESREKLGDKHPQTLDAIFAKGLSTIRTGSELNTFTPTAEKLLEDRRRVLGPEHRDTLDAASLVAAVYMNTGRFAESEAILRKILDTQRRVLGASDPAVYGTLVELGACLLFSNQLQESAAVLKESCDAYEKLYGPDHPYTVTARQSWAAAMMHMGREEVALDAFRAVEAAQSKLLGAAHAETAWTRNYLALCLHKKGECKEAMALFKKALKVLKKNQGKYGPTVMTVQTNIAKCMAESGSLEKADKLVSGLLALPANRLPETAPSRILLLSSASEIDRKLGRAASAVEKGEKSVQLAEKVFGPKFTKIGDLRLVYGEALAADGQYEKAEQVIQQAIQELRSSGSDGQRGKKAEVVLGDVYKAWGKPEKAAKLLTSQPATSRPASL